VSSDPKTAEIVSDKEADLVTLPPDDAPGLQIGKSGQPVNQRRGAATAAQAAVAGKPAQVSTSRGFRSWLVENKLSMAFTSYQTGQLFLIGCLADGKVSIHQRNFVRAMGLAGDRNRIFLGCQSSIWRLENALGPKQRANKNYDRMYMPRMSNTTGDIDIHELGLESPSNRLVFVNTKYSCLATTSPNNGFKPLWKPSFISRLAPEDRCHLNGLCLDNGKVRYVTAVSRSDVVTGWRDRRHEGGVLVDVTNDKIVSEKLSMPHSPRMYNDQVVVLDSGRGMISRVDKTTGRPEGLAFCPGFLRGLSIHKHFAVVTLSLPRDQTFAGLELDNTLKARDAEPWCGIQVVDLRNGDILHWLRLKGDIRELFDVTVLPGVECPMAVGPGSPEIQSVITYDQEWGVL
jgi:uncharacterized protein (TIGR03032 family)